ncbi:MAG TPA: ATP-binding cassette domain-containing protein, partial [Rhodopila sp.]|nr:ATP-binding cassette domain-containing protein [Rhodopila sp.]
EAGQRLAGQALGMTPLVLMRHVIAPQAIRIMVPALGNETISALKNSSLASVISVEELTLRSTQLASSTFDFFSIFFASGLIYLGLTGAVSGIQVLVETWLDLDRPAGRLRLLQLLPWVRAPLVAAQPAQPPARPVRTEPAPAASTPATARPLRATALAHGQPMIEVQGLHKHYGDHAVLNGIDLTIRSGEVVALLGPSGSGKSTLLRCINHLEQWDAGTVRVGGRRLGFTEDGRRLSPRALAQERADIGVGMVFQQFNLFSHVTARENIAGPLRWVHGMLRSAADRRATELLERVGLIHRADALPRHMSGGQQQRIAIARAIAPNPSVLLLDEPTSALDPELVNEVLDVIRRLAVEDGLTMIISTHQLRFAYEVADRVVFLDQGVIIEEGPAQALLSAPRHPATARFLQAMEGERVTGATPPGQLVERPVV